MLGVRKREKLKGTSAPKRGMPLTDVKNGTKGIYHFCLQQGNIGCGEVGKSVVKILINMMVVTHGKQQPGKCSRSAPPYCVLEETQGAIKHSTGILLHF